MPRSPAQSDFVIRREPPAIPGDGDPAEHANEASDGAIRLVMTLALVVLVLLVLLAMGLHIPSGG